MVLIVMHIPVSEQDNQIIVILVSSQSLPQQVQLVSATRRFHIAALPCLAQPESFHLHRRMVRMHLLEISYRFLC